MTERAIDALFLTQRCTLVKGTVEFFADKTALVLVDKEAHPHLKEDTTLNFVEIMVKLIPTPPTQGQLN